MKAKMVSVRKAANMTGTFTKTIRKAYENGEIEGEIVGEELMLYLSSVVPWGKRLRPGGNSNRKKGRSSNDGSSQKSHRKAQSEIHQTFDPDLYDHQISGYSKYDNHSEDSYRDHYDLYDDDDPARYS